MYHQHDCDKCTYLGSDKYDGQECDVYLTCDKSVYRYIARFGSDGDYVTVNSHNKALYEFCEHQRKSLITKLLYPST